MRILRTLIPTFPAIKIIITFGMVTTFTPSRIIQSDSKREDKLIDQSSCFLEVKIEESSVQATPTICITNSLYSGTLIVQDTQESYTEGALTQQLVIRRFAPAQFVKDPTLYSPILGQ